MSANLVVIEAPGKRKLLSSLLWRAGMRDVTVMATAGHICANPEALRPLDIDAKYRETAYRIKPRKENLAAEICKAAKKARRVFLATDDDQEGDVIARDIVRFCLDEEDKGKAVRFRMKALAFSEVQAAMAATNQFILDELAAAQGDARRVIDRLIGSLSGDDGAVGRVQGSMLLLLQEQRPVVGVMTYALKAADGKLDWIAQMPVYAGQSVPHSECMIEGVAAAGRSEASTLANQGMNHNEIILSASLATGKDIASISKAMQNLYEKGRITYPRANSNAITRDSSNRLQAIARINGAGFVSERFRALRALDGEHTHEAPNPMVIDIPLNRQFDLLSFEDQVLVHIARQLIECGISSRVETPCLSDLARLPNDLALLRWHRVIPVGERLWQPSEVRPGFQTWTQEQSLFHFMSRNGLGRPSTVVSHVDKFLTRGLIDEHFDFTAKGREWNANIGELFRHQNLSKTIEDYIKNNKKLPSEMIRDMIKICKLECVESVIQQEVLVHEEHDEIQPG